MESDEPPVRFREHPIAALFQEPGFLRERKDAAKAKEATEKEAAAAAANDKAVEARNRLKVKVGRRATEVSLPACGCCCEHAEPAAPEGKKSGGGDGLAAGIWKAIGAAAAGITATGAIVAVGAAETWIRFNAVGIPATQAISVQPKGESLALGAQETMIFVGIALVAVLLVYFADPEGVIRWVTLALLAGLAVGAGTYIVFGTHLGCWSKVALIILAVTLLVGCVAVGHRTDTLFWPLALSVFVASLIFSAATGILIVKQQKFVQGVAILRGASDSGLTGVYIAATDKTIYFAQNVTRDEDQKSRMAMLEVPREGATYAVGPLESRGDAALRERLMLEQLVSSRERGGVTPEEAPKEPGTDVGAKEEEEAKKGEEKSKSEADSSTGESERATGASEAKTVAEAFGAGAVEIHRTVAKPWDCLVRYASAGSGLLGRWWTSCKTADEFERDRASMFTIRDELALPSRFQLAYDMRVKAHLQLGAEVTYITGPVAPQCEHAKPMPCGYRWKGSAAGSGVEQIFLPEPQLVEGPRRKCTETAIAETPKWMQCKSQP
ncbi:MAG TPA: hypothetical protein VNC16_04880 [Solirubrobacterales bacterium]|nr:hypothetical protein [Solirubrobacterales bacterium]